MDAKRVLALLKDLEFSCRNSYDEIECPICGGGYIERYPFTSQYQSYIAHEPDCELVAVMRELQNELQ